MQTLIPSIETSQMEELNLAIPEVVSSRYKFLQKIGQGDQSNVFLIQNKSNGRILVGKVLKSGTSHNTLVREIEHPYISTLIDYIEIGNFRVEIYPPCSLTEGVNKSGDYIRFNPKTLENTDFSIQLLARCFSQIFSAITYCHENRIVVRDIKARNILVYNLEDSENICFKLNDLGLARRFRSFDRKTELQDYKDFAEVIFGCIVGLLSGRENYALYKNIREDLSLIIKDISSALTHNEVNKEYIFKLIEKVTQLGYIEF